jgi:hypothetical protein
MKDGIVFSFVLANSFITWNKKTIAKKNMLLKTETFLGVIELSKILS